jgi:hypothetical protein
MAKDKRKTCKTKIPAGSSFYAKLFFITWVVWGEMGIDGLVRGCLVSLARPATFCEFVV